LQLLQLCQLLAVLLQRSLELHLLACSGNSSLNVDGSDAGFGAIDKADFTAGFGFGPL
jgi:hypothetical protein